ncbi:MAG: glycerol acyltransferase, partial [Pseudomonadota bacterium]
LAAPEVEPYLLPVDFGGTKEAMKTNIETRATSISHLKDGGCIIIFPAGGISTAKRPFTTALDDEWKPFTAKLISASAASVTPIFFEGQNSNLFQVASHISLSLRLSLVFREVKRRMGTTVPVHIGKTLTQDDLATAGKRAELMMFLRRQTYGLAPEKLRRKIERKDRAIAS